MGFAAFRPDGLVGLRAGYGSEGRGVVLTKPLLLDTNVSHLLLNMNSGVGGEVRVAIHDAVTGAEVKGLGYNNSRPLTRNSLRARASWVGCERLAACLADAGSHEAIRLQFTLEDAWLFSFSFV